MFEHPVRYVFIDAKTGDYSIINETWPPMINNVSIWDTENLSWGELIEIYSILSEPMLITGTTTTAPEGDYGDAPDGQDAYYGVPGAFPTLFNTTNSKLDRPGGHTLTVGQEMLGFNVSAEVNANDPNDPDGMPNLVDADSDDRMFLLIEDGMARLVFDVTVDDSAPDVVRYVNALIDFDQSGNWGGDASGKEWVVVNLEVDVPPGTTRTIITPRFLWGSGTVLPSPVWMRVSLTRAQVEETLFSGIGGWDGSGGYEYGEIEDFLFFLRDCPPSEPPEDGGPSVPPGPDIGPCGYPVEYYALIIDGGEHPGRTGTTEVADGMYKLVKAQRYSTAYLGPSKGGDVNDLNTEANIQKAINKLKEEVKCGDRILIFIIGHGSHHGKYIALQGGGKTKEKLTPGELDNWLGGIPECDGHDCNEEHVCCSVSIVIESCYAGNFLSPLAEKGRIVAVSSTKDQTSNYGSDGNGGEYSDGLINAFRDSAADSNGDGAVDTVEAHASAKDFVQARRGGVQTPPDVENQECECICPRKPMYFDDFSEPSSGWPVEDRPCHALDYNNGNYRIQVKWDNWFYRVPAPFRCADCTIEVEAWRSTGDKSYYGIVFGLTNMRFYVFRVDPGRQKYSMYRRDGDKWVRLIPSTYSSHIKSGYSHNVLKVVRDGSHIKLYVNGHYLDSYRDSTYTGTRYVGLYAESGSVPPVWLRYDNFTVWPVECRVEKQIAFHSKRSGNADIWVMNADGTNLRQLTTDPALDAYPAWSLDGRFVAFHSKRSGNADIWVMNADGTNLRQLTTDPTDDGFPNWSLDGRLIAFCSKRSGNWDIWVMNADGTNLRQLTTDLATDACPDWSPDGHAITFQSERSDNAEIWVMNADGMNQRQLTTIGGAWPAWSPDGRSITFHSKHSDNQDIWVMNADGTNLRQLTIDPANDRDPTSSPDGRLIAFVSNRDGNDEIYVMSADGSDQTKLTNNPADDGGPAWSPR